MNEDQLRELLEKFGQGLEDVLNRFGSTSGELNKGKKSIDDFVKSLNRQSKNLDKDLKDLALGLKVGTKGYKDQKSLIDKLNNAIEEQLDLAEETSDAQEKELRRAKAKEMQEKKLEIERQSRYTKVGETLEKSTEYSYKSITKGAGAFVNGLQSGSSATQLAAGIFTTGIDVFSSGLNVAADGANTAGAALFMLPTPASKLAGALLMAGGTLMEFVAGPGAELAKFGIGVLAKQIDMVVESYDKVLTAGGGFATGLDGLTDAATSSFLTVNQFSKVMEQNSNNIAMAGLGFTQTIEKLSAVQKRFSDDNGRVRKQLMNLGYSFEDQASLILETMADMRRGGLLARSSDAEIERQTMEYAKNLRIISQITGDDAKKRMADARTQMQNMAVQQKLLEMQRTNPEAYKKLQAQLATLPAEAQKMYLQKITLGTVVDPVSAALMAQVPQMDQALNGMQQVLNDNTKDAEDAAVDAGKQRALMRQGLENNMSTLGIMGQAQMAGVGGLVADVGSMAGAIFDQVAGQTAESAEKARENVEASLNATGKLTEGMRIAAVEAQNLALAMQKELLPLMKDYAKVTEKVMHFFNKMISGSGIGERKPGFDGSRVTLPPATFPDADKAESLGLVKKMKDGRVVRTEPTFPDAANAPTYPVKKYADGGKLDAGKVGIAGETGPELISGPANVLSKASTEKLIVALDAMREMKGERLGKNDFEWNVVMEQSRLATLKDRTSAFEGLDISALESELKKRPEVEGPMAKARAAMMEGEMDMGKPVDYLKKSINQIQHMMSGLKPDAQAGGQNSGFSNGSTTPSFVKNQLEEYLQNIENPEKIRNGEGSPNSSPKGSMVQDAASNDYIKNLAENSIKMVEELRRVSNAMSDNNRMTSGILQNTY